VKGVAIAVGVMFAAQMVAGQAAFEVATVKPSTVESGPMAIRRTAGQFLTVSTPVSFLIRWAYDLDESQLIGASRRIGSQAFDIVAKIPEGELAPGQLKLMMQALLAERFKLRVHRESRTLQTYALRPGKEGIKVHFVELEGGIGQQPFKMTDRGRLVGTKVTAEMLARVLAEQVGRPVVDETGLTRPFDLVLEWSPDLDGATPTKEGQNRPSIFTALPEQLGMRLESRSAAAEVVVIDSVLDRPTEN
jgi:uncharacterized protein (TIGR03435 family)